MIKKILLIIVCIIVGSIAGGITKGIVRDYFNDTKHLKNVQTTHSYQQETSKQKLMNFLERYVNEMNKNVDKTNQEGRKRYGIDYIEVLYARVIDNKTIGFYYRNNSVIKSNYFESDLQIARNVALETVKEQCKNIEPFTKQGIGFLYIYLDKNNNELYRILLDKEICSK